ncbi:DUF4345 domain-containing protein [Oceanicoccus sagamiensis]|uniref:DUF4345 domain-containing protein n=1 Tax=Oceanicoccus sagamiensis TaxID=716816 RepID=A0A1X9NDA2_9GAMM|nr:DUF4345 domain-containing protein [Oceanicoccus sagamiensis]ARN76028.1 hypothetical protein BST96_19170 [Oceanicoccus sagamiensis]
MKLARGFLIFNGLIFGSYGIQCLLDPAVVSELTGMQLSTNTAIIEVRAMYGGLQLTMGLYLLYCAMQIVRVSQGLLVAIFIFAGMAGARSFGLAIDGGDSGYNIAATAYESICGVIAVFLLQKSHQTTTAGT